MKRMLIVAWLAVAGSAASAGEIAQRFDSLAKHGLTEPTTLPAGDKGESITEIGIERANTFMLHGGYSIILKRDGSFQYEGETDAGQIERHTGQAGANAFERLAAYLAGSGFMRLEKSYRSNSTDQDTVYAMVVTDGRAKIVKDYGAAAPVNLWAIEYIIRGMVMVQKWNDPPATTRPATQPSVKAAGPVISAELASGGGLEKSCFPRSPRQKMNRRVSGNGGFMFSRMAFWVAAVALSLLDVGAINSDR